jgi:hypothetical protein
MKSMEDDLRKNKSEASADDLPYCHTYQAYANMKAEDDEDREYGRSGMHDIPMRTEEEYQRRGEIHSKFSRICGNEYRGSATVRRGDVIIPKE